MIKIMQLLLYYLKNLDSLVFFDDDPVNCEFVKKALPMVKTINLPKDSSFYSQILMNLPDFNLYQITKEDELRGKMYYMNGN
jgi:predicted enzyme involved in methoxymalonyl-ACP biosynthesis